MNVMTAPAEPPVDLEDQRRSARKRRAILDAATTTFLSKGYLGTSMDEIAALAQVSKQTVYKHFADKQSLFTEIVTGTSMRSATRSTTRSSGLPTAAISRQTCAI